MLKRLLSFSTAMGFLALCLTTSTAWAVERCVLAELFTEVDCIACPHAEGALDSLTEEYPDSCLAIIRYHAETGDIFYRVESGSRKAYYYSWPWYNPTAYFDGLLKVQSAASESAAYSAYKDSIEKRRAIPSPLNMSLSVTYDTLSLGGQASVQVIAVDSVGPDTLHLRYALIESGLIHEDDEYQEVLRDMYPDAEGVSFTIAQGDTFRDTLDFTLDSLWLPQNCDLVTFVQDDSTQEVLQSIQRWIPLPQVPAVVEDLEITLSGSQLLLTWPPVIKDQYGHPLSIDYYRVFRDTSRYFVPGAKALLDSTEELFYLDASCGQVGDPQVNCFYYVTAVAGGLESSSSRAVGEFDMMLKNAK